MVNLEFVMTTLYHAICTITYGISIGYQATHIPVKVVNAALADAYGTWKYFSFWNVVCLFVLHLLNVYCRLIKKSKKNRIMFQFRDIVHHSMALPFSMMVPFLFWPVYLVNRDWIYPPNIEIYRPQWLNHINNTLVIFTVLISECREFKHRNQLIDQKVSKIIPLVTCILSSAIGLGFDKWTYGFIKYQPLAIKLVCIMFLGAVQLFFHHLASWLHLRLWKKQELLTQLNLRKKKK